MLGLAEVGVAAQVVKVEVFVEFVNVEVFAIVLIVPGIFVEGFAYIGVFVEIASIKDIFIVVVVAIDVVISADVVIAGCMNFFKFVKVKKVFVKGFV